MPLSAVQLSQTWFPDELMLTISREFQATKPRLWQLHTDPNHLANWLVPDHATITVLEFNFQCAGAFRYHIQCPNQPPGWVRWTYHQIAAADTLIYFEALTDADGHPIRPTHQPHWPLQLYSNLTFTENSTTTPSSILTLKLAPWNASEKEHQTFNCNRRLLRSDHHLAWDRLERYLAQLTTTPSNTTSASSSS
jgi:uncharacterized protein YndB with AHSA1/START domain